MQDGGTEATPSAGLPEGASQSGTAKAANGSATAAKAATKAERKATKAERKATKAERKAAAKAVKGVAKAERKAAAKAKKAAAKEAAKAERKSAKCVARAAAIADQGNEPAPKPIAARAAQPKPAVARDVAPASSTRVRKANPPRRRAAQAQASGPRVDGVGGASGMLQEVADLVRQAAEPAASRIVERVGRSAGDRSVDEPAAAPGAEPTVLAAEPEPADLAAEPEPTVLAAEPEPADLAAEPEPTVLAAEPEPADLAAEPEPTVLAAEPALVQEPETSLPGATPAPVAADVAGPVRPTPGAAVLTPGAVIGAAVDIGANSAHLLVAAAGGHRVEPLLDESVFLGLGDRVTAGGFIGARARQDLVSALVTYAATARRMGARDITILGTEPVRRAADAAMLVHAVEAAAGVPLHVLGHDEEAMLTLLGVTSGRPVHTDMLVVDVGGGSCELVLAGRDGVVQASGIALGSARLTQDVVRTDPPTLPEIEAMRTGARTALAGAPDAHPADLVAVGGTASNLLRLMPLTSLDRVLTRRRIAVALAMLTVLPSAEAAARHLLRPQRARILPAGAVIVDAVLERYGVGHLRVVEEGIREGAVLAAAIAGPAWRDRLPELVRGWSDGGLPVG